MEFWYHHLRKKNLKIFLSEQMLVNQMQNNKEL